MTINREIKELLKKKNTLKAVREQCKPCDIKVSVFVLCYNHQNYIKHFIESALEQLVDFGVEIIIHDDCSTDNSANIITDYSKKYPNIIIPILRSQNLYKHDRKTIYKDMFEKSSGKYIAFCEGDDKFSDPLKLYLQTHLLDMHADCKFATHYANKININNGDKIGIIPQKRIVSSVYYDRFAFELFSNFQHPQTSSYFVNKHTFSFFLKNLDRLSQIVEFDDMSIFLLSIFKNKFIFINRYMSDYSCFVPNGWMESRKRVSICQKIEHYEALIKYYKAMDEICEYKFSKYFEKISNDRLLELLYLRGKYSGIIKNKTLSTLLWKKNKKRFLMLKLMVNHPKIYAILKKK